MIEQYLAILNARREMNIQRVRAELARSAAETARDIALRQHRQAGSIDGECERVDADALGLPPPPETA